MGLWDMGGPWIIVVWTVLHLNKSWSEGDCFHHFKRERPDNLSQTSKFLRIKGCLQWWKKYLIAMKSSVLTKEVLWWRGIDIVSMSLDCAVQCDSHSHTELGTLGMYLFWIIVCSKYKIHIGLLFILNFLLYTLDIEDMKKEKLSFDSLFYI